jgi:hypothetical protein
MRSRLLPCVLLWLCGVSSQTGDAFAQTSNATRFGSQPPARVGAGGALTDAGTALFFGGLLQGGALAAPDVWEYNPGVSAFCTACNRAVREPALCIAVLDRWACLCDSGAGCASPPARTGHTTSSAGSKLVVFGGRSAQGASLTDVWVFDISAGACCSCSRRLCQRADALVAASAQWDEVRMLDGAAVQPLPRAGHSAVILPPGTAPGFTLLGALPCACTACAGCAELARPCAPAAFGGASADGAVLDDVWQLDVLLANATAFGNWTAIRRSDSVSSGAAARGCRRELALLMLVLAACLHAVGGP